MAKIILFFCAIILASAVASPSKVADDNLIDIVKKIVHKIEDLLDKVYEKAPAFIDGFADNYDDDLKKALESLEEIALKALRQLRPLIDKIAEGSNDAGKKLVSCIESHDTEIVDIRIQVLDEVAKCIKNDLVALVKTLGPIVKDLAPIHEQAKDAADEIDECEGNDATTLACVAQVAGDLLQVLVKIPEAVKGDIKPVIEAAIAIAKDGLQCSKDQIEPFFANAGKLLGEVASCAAA
ncbi:uncharacterized protein LOC126887305 [Diabrotica virgifera virgifera]|uniref:Uncharacterized protein n=1 Tax=Diabrotica virgifera virgifera TaxID=50390 RepID=A0ABM5KKF9_DIAVI|nr:uncharacterized protein LOC126887305 [Diabrotica virgifera virgifera]